MASIYTLRAREILDSRGIPTVECTVWLDNGMTAVASVPSGTSRGKYESVQIRDAQNPHLLGRGVLQVVSNINTVIAPYLIGQDPTQQNAIDQMLVNLDGTENKRRLGANALMAVSQAAVKAGAMSVGMPLYYYLQQKYQLTDQLVLPTMIYSMIDGGKHGTTNLDFQEFQVIPASHVDFPTSLEIAVTIFQKLGEILMTKGAIHSVGVGGGYAPNLYNNTDAFEILIETIKNSPYTFIQDLFFGVDIAASEFFQNGKYALKDKSQPYSCKELLEYYKNMRKIYHVFSIEDPFQEDDWESWQTMMTEIGETTTIIGDNLLGSKARTQQAITQKACNAILVKPDQYGTVTETLEVVQLAKSAGWQVVASHRSGDTNDDFIADFAVGIGANSAKFGPPNRGERIAKLNRLWQIYNEINGL